MMSSDDANIPNDDGEWWWLMMINNCCIASDRSWDLWPGNFLGRHCYDFSNGQAFMISGVAPWDVKWHGSQEIALGDSGTSMVRWPTGHSHVVSIAPAVSMLFPDQNGSLDGWWWLVRCTSLWNLDIICCHLSPGQTNSLSRIWGPCVQVSIRNIIISPAHSDQPDLYQGKPQLCAQSMLMPQSN